MKALITHMYDDWSSYHVEEESDCRDEIDLHAYKLFVKLGSIIGVQVGKVCVSLSE